MPTGLVLLSLLLTTAVASAQPTIARVQPAPVRSASTCGWSFFTPSARPPALEEHAGRAGIGANDVAAALALLERWYRACDEKAAREGVRLLAGVLRETGWPEVALELAETALATRSDESLRQAARAIESLPGANGRRRSGVRLRRSAGRRVCRCFRSMIAD